MFSLEFLKEEQSALLEVDVVTDRPEGLAEPAPAFQDDGQDHLAIEALGALEQREADTESEDHRGEEEQVALESQAEGGEEQGGDEVRPVEHGQREEHPDLVDDEQRKHQNEAGEQVPWAALFGGRWHLWSIPNPLLPSGQTRLA